MQLPDSYEFFSQAKINSGKKAMSHIPFELASMDARKPIVITSKELADAGAGKKIVKALYDSNVVIGGLFDEVNPYAGMGQIEDLAVLFHDRGCDSIIAVGGGAVMNTAKGLNILVSEKKNIMEFAGKDNITKRLKPLVYVGAGAADCNETSGYAYIENHQFFSDFLFPDVVILDDQMVCAGDALNAVDSSLIALAVSAEACAYEDHNMIGGLYANAVMKFIFDYLPVALKKPNNKKACLALANAYTAAGIAMSNSIPGLATLIGSAISEDTGLSRGICTGIMLPFSLEFSLLKKQKVRGELLYAMKGIEEFCGTPAAERADRSIQLLRELLQQMDKFVPASLKDLNIPEYKLEGYAAQAVEKGGRRFKHKDCVELLNNAWNGNR